MKRYYDLRAPEYDATTYELTRQDPASVGDLVELEHLLAELPSGRVLDIGCGTGLLTRFLRGSVVALDQSESMLQRTRERLPHAVLVHADVPPMPFAAHSFDRALAAHLYGHIERERDRRWFLDEGLRVARELIVIEQAWNPSLPQQAWEQRSLADGSEHRVFKRYFTAAGLAAELAGEIVLDTATLVGAVVRV
jgi:ubiquinone/menaquinone biosynthesis C-methylase UbiE